MRRIRNVEVPLVLTILGSSEAVVAQVMELNLRWIKAAFGDEYGVAARIGESEIREPFVEVTVTRVEEG